MSLNPRAMRRRKDVSSPYARRCLDALKLGADLCSSMNWRNS
jgi:hypothetical protein